MANSKHFSSVLAPVITPFNGELVPDKGRFLRHCQWLLANGCSGLVIFGSSGEANSLSVGEKFELLEVLISGGIPAEALMVGTGHCALTDSVALTRQAMELGCGGVLMLPPFYYKSVSDEGLYRSFAEVIERVGNAQLRLYLYHIPPVSQVPISLALIERLLGRYSGVVAGVKDSSGDWNNTLAMLKAFAESGFDVFNGSEEFLVENLRNGGKGCITATANINSAAIDRVCRAWRSAEGARLQSEITALRRVLEQFPMIAALKSILARYGGDSGWRRLRPPLVELDEAQTQVLFNQLRETGFDPTGLQSEMVPVLAVRD